MGGDFIATTRIIPMHINKGKTLAQCLTDRTDYAKNPDKTHSGELVSSFMCDADLVVIVSFSYPSKFTYKKQAEYKRMM